MCVAGVVLLALVFFLGCDSDKKEADPAKAVDNEAVAQLKEVVKAQQELIEKQQAVQQQTAQQQQLDQQAQLQAQQVQQQQPVVVQGQQESGMDMSDVILTAAATNMAMNALSGSNSNNYRQNNRVIHNTTVKKVYVPQRKASRSFFKSNRSFKSSRSFSRPSRRR